MASKGIGWAKAFLLASGCGGACVISVVAFFLLARSLPATNAQPWNVGGTLHRATVAQWRAATHENKLATAADWLASYAAASGVRIGDVNDASLMRAAANLAGCIDEGTRGIHAVSESKAYDVADACWKIMLAQYAHRAVEPSTP